MENNEEQDIQAADEINEDEEVEEVVDEESTEEEDGDDRDSTIEDLKAKLADANDKIAKKRISKRKANQKETQSNETEGFISQRDMFTLVAAKVAEDDVDEVVDYAKHKGISVKEALSSNVVKAILAEKQAERKTAEATNTSGARRGSAKITSERLMQNAELKGELPESDDDIKRLIRQRRGMKD